MARRRACRTDVGRMSAVDRHDSERERVNPQLVVDTCLGLFLFFVVLGLFALAYGFCRLLAP